MYNQVISKKKIFYLTAVFTTVVFVLLSSSLNVFAASVNTVDKAQFNKTIAYVVTTGIAFALLLGYCAVVKKKEITFLFLFIAVFVINMGYAFGSSSKTLPEALLANKISYVGAVFLPLLMLVIIMDECRYKRNKLFLAGLMCISGGIFFLTMTPGYTPWYYRSAQLIFVNGGAKLVKEYGPLHGLYLWYLVLYFTLMLALIVWAILKRDGVAKETPFALLVLVLCNILIWFIEQKVNFDFEFLAISYLVTEVFLLLIYNIKGEYVYQHTNNEYIPAENETVKVSAGSFDTSGTIPDIEDIIEIWPQVATLTTREMEVFKEIIINKKRKDIAEDLCVSENTVKKHISNIFTKLEVSSRADIMNVLLKVR